MKLSEYTLEIFKNFAAINDGLVMFKKFSTPEGTTIKTIDKNISSPNIQAVAFIPEQIENDVCFSNLNLFLAVLKTFEEPEVDFSHNQVKVNDQNSVASIVYNAPETIIHNYAEIKFPEPRLVFTLKEDDLEKLQTNARILQLPDYKLFVDNGTVVIQAVNRKNPSSNGVKVTLDKTDATDFTPMFFESQYFVFVKGTYEVKIVGGVANFSNTSCKLEYNVVSIKTPKAKNE